MFSCAKDQSSITSAVDSSPIAEKDLLTLIEDLEANSRQIKRMSEEARDRHTQSYRNSGCTETCDLDLSECLDCVIGPLVTSSYFISGCEVHFSYRVLECLGLEGYYSQFQIVDFQWWLGSGCTHSGLLLAYDINYNPMIESPHSTYFDIITRYILNRIEEEVIYPSLDPNFSGVVAVKTIIQKNCYQWCDFDGLQKVCSTGCCLRSTQGWAENGVVTEEVSDGAWGPEFGTCPDENDVAIDCAATTYTVREISHVIIPINNIARPSSVW